MKRALFQLQYEIDSPATYSEQGAEQGAKLSVDTIGNAEVRSVLQQTAHMTTKELLKWLGANKEGLKETVVVPLTTSTPEALRYRVDGHRPKLLYLTRPLHTQENLNLFLATANELLDDGAFLCCHSMTAALKRQMLRKKYPWGVRTVATAADYLWNRVAPKLRLTHRLYYSLTHGKSRTFTRVEILGRLYRAGFEVIDEQFRSGEYFVVACKTKAPVDDTPPTGSPIIHLRRTGKEGKEIVVHKFRTMYTYSEYIQPYVYQYQHLQSGGKFKDDYRVNTVGRVLRRTWLDELPMVWNMLRGDIKLVGVRPLSRQYFSLYTPEMQELRTRTKPGLLPPFYYERHTPETLDEIQASERRYLEAYLQHPFRTDWRYFWGIMGNIILNHKRSK
ncbi:MAG: sugar transferase [Bacteroidales bacterium]|nr:sugar transferase [Bacteroidales bacterium]